MHRAAWHTVWQAHSLWHYVVGEAVAAALVARRLSPFQAGDGTARVTLCHFSRWHAAAGASPLPFCEPAVCSDPQAASFQAPPLDLPFSPFLPRAPIPASALPRALCPVPRLGWWWGGRDSIHVQPIPLGLVSQKPPVPLGPMITPLPPQELP